jgi:hypothetical protein
MQFPMPIIADRRRVADNTRGIIRGIPFPYSPFLAFLASSITFFAAKRFLVLWVFDLCLPIAIPALFAIYIF